MHGKKLKEERSKILWNKITNCWNLQEAVNFQYRRRMPRVSPMCLNSGTEPWQSKWINQGITPENPRPNDPEADCAALPMEICLACWTTFCSRQDELLEMTSVPSWDHEYWLMDTYGWLWHYSIYLCLSVSILQYLYYSIYRILMYHRTIDYMFLLGLWIWNMDDFGLMWVWINTNDVPDFGLMNIQESQLFWCENQM